jgi:hypothetical protein
MLLRHNLAVVPPSRVSRGFGEHRRIERPRADRGLVPPLGYRFVDPKRSLPQARQLDAQSQTAWLPHLGEGSEEIVRASIPDVSADDARWGGGAACLLHDLEAKARVCDRACNKR